MDTITAPYILEAPAVVVAPGTENPPVCLEAMKIRFRRWYTQLGKEIEPEIQKRWAKALIGHMATCETCQARNTWFNALAERMVYPDLSLEQIQNA